MIDEVNLPERSSSILRRAIFVSSGGHASHGIQLFFRKLGELGLPVVFFLDMDKAGLDIYLSYRLAKCWSMWTHSYSTCVSPPLPGTDALDFLL